MKIENLAFLHYEDRATAQHYVDWAIQEMEHGCETEEVVQLACLDLVKPLVNDEVEEAFKASLTATNLTFPTKDEAVRGQIQSWHASLLYQPQMETLQSLVHTAQQYNLKDLAYVWEAIEETVLHAPEEERHRVLQQEAKRTWVPVQSTCLQKFTGKSFSEIEWTKHLILSVSDDSWIRIECPWRVTHKGNIVFGATDMEEDSREGLERLKKRFLHEPLHMLRAETDNLRLLIGVGDYVLEAWPMSYQYEGWTAYDNGDVLTSLPGGQLG